MLAKKLLFAALSGAALIAATSANAHRAELARRFRLDDAVDVLTLFRFRLSSLQLFVHHSLPSAGQILQ